MFEKMMKLSALGLFFAFFLFQNVGCATYNFGGCPRIKSFENFNISKFLGLWYIVEASDISISCATMNFKATKSSSKFDVEQSTNFKTIPFVKHIVTKTGKMKIIEKDNPAGLKIQWHWSSPSEYMVVFDTDHSNYAGVLLCSQMGFASETKVYTLSRTSTLSASFKDKVKESLKLNDFSTTEMHKIDHKDCPTDKSKDTFKLKINADTLSPKSIGDKIEKTIKDNFDRKDCSRESSEEQTTEK